jgi:hypothetical protein
MYLFFTFSTPDALLNVFFEFATNYIRAEKVDGVTDRGLCFLVRLCFLSISPFREVQSG